ncbi:PEGA domain-containing protein [Sorangium sp. So ce375]|uniref:PEGA domain-containing protein n=1 Tax=Sorangium sp. So ce375 TaxID=3133306 RepID=UPI003F5BBBFE
MVPGRAASLTILLAHVLLSRGTALAQPAPAASESAEERRREAETRFFKARDLYTEGAVGAALAEFQASRALYPGESSTIGAATCLRRLHRFDEALDLFEAALRAYPSSMEAKTRAAVQREVVELRGLVGTVDIEGAEPGAAITVDGQSRGEFPLLAPLRVAAGSHAVRVHLEGFEPFETRVQVAGGQTARVSARLHRLTQAGTLQISEARGRELEVVVDGVGVGRTSATPLSLALAPGTHVVLLRGKGCLGTMPAKVTVRLNQVQSLRLEAQVLKATLRIAPEPPDARVSIDAVELGQGIWEGQVCGGTHTVEVAAEGFLPETREISLRRGEREVLSLPLLRDPRSSLWRKAPRLPHFLVEFDTAALIVESFGGDVAGSCLGGCSRSLGVGTYAVLRGGYELRSGVSFGVSIGALSVTQHLSDRSTSLNIVSEPPKDIDIDADDVLRLRGVFLGGWIGYATETDVPVRFRLGAGGIFGSMSDARHFTPSDGGRPESVAYVQHQPARFAFVTPEVRVSLPLSKHVELNAGLELPMLFAVSRPRWSTSGEAAVRAGSDGAGYFDDDAFVGGVLVTVAPTVGARFDF